MVKSTFYEFLCVFAKLWKVTLSLVMSAHPCIHMEQLSSYWAEFNEFWHLSIFWKSVKRTQVWVKSDENNKYFTWRHAFILIISHWILLRIRMFQTKVVEKIETHSLCSITFFQKLCCLWGKVEEYGRSRWTTNWNKIQPMCFPCCVTKGTDTHTHTICNIYSFFMATVVICFPHSVRRTFSALFQVAELHLLLWTFLVKVQDDVQAGNKGFEYSCVCACM